MCGELWLPALQRAQLTLDLVAEQLRAGRRACATDLRAYGAVRVMGCVLVALDRARDACADACLERVLGDLPVVLRLPRQQPAARRAQIRAVEVQADAATQVGHVVL